MKPYKRFRVMLADSGSVTNDFDSLPYPLLGSFKKDGIRCIISPTRPEDIDLVKFTPDAGGHHFAGWQCDNFGSHPLTRSLKYIPNLHARKLLATLPPGLDGELGVVIDGVLNFRETTHAIMSPDGEPDIRYFVFDDFLKAGGYEKRLSHLRRGELPSWVSTLIQRRISDPDDAESFYQEALNRGEEGLILRSLDGPYKPGRSSRKEGFMLKAKAKEDAEGTVIEVLPEFENTNEATKDANGRTKRATKKAGKVQRERAGKLVLESPRFPGLRILVGTGFTDAERVEFWTNQPIGKLAKFEFATAGGYDAPRFPSFKGIRDPSDM